MEEKKHMDWFNSLPLERQRTEFMKLFSFALTNSTLEKKKELLSVIPLYATITPPPGITEALGNIKETPEAIDMFAQHLQNEAQKLESLQEGNNPPL
jgi:hypothetical protein